MNERELFAAYGSLPSGLPRARREENVERMKEGLRRLGYKKCSHPGCITLIALLTDRQICSFHSRTDGNP